MARALARLGGRGPAAVFIVVAAMLALEVAYGAPVLDALLFLLYQVSFRVVPGVLLLRILSSRPGSGIRQLALGWALGSGLETAFFLVTAALDVRALFAVYPLVIASAAGAVLVRRGPAPAHGPAPVALSARTIWATAGVSLLAMGLIAVVMFPAVPLPGAEAIDPNRDFSWHLGLAGEAKRHWPITDPNVAGEPFPYHWFAHLHMAGASQVTGIELSTVFFRLFSLPLVLLIVLLFATAGSSLLRSVPAGLGAACLALFVGDLQLQTEAAGYPIAPFLGVLVTLLITSPSFLFGLASFLALAIAIGERLAPDRTPPGTAGDWGVVAMLTFAASNAKVSALPVVAIALGLWGGWRLLRTRRFPTAALADGLLVTVVLGVTYFTQYAGHSSGLTVDPLATIESMPVVQTLRDYISDALPAVPLKTTLLGAAGVILGLLGLLGPQLAGASWMGLQGPVRVPPGWTWLAALLASGVLFLLLSFFPGGGNQLYFVFLGVAAGCLLGAYGFERALRERPAQIRRPRTAAALAVAWLGLLLLIMRAPVDLGLEAFAGAANQGRVLVVWYGGLFLSLALLALATIKLLRPARWWAFVLVAGALVVVGGGGSIANYVAPALRAEAPRRKTPPSAVTPSGYRALRWIEANTAENAVLAVNVADPFRFTYSGFAERPVYLAGWAYSRRTYDDGYEKFLAGTVDPFGERRRAVRGAFAGQPGAVAALRRAGVRYLIVDPTGNLPVDRAALKRSTRLVYGDDGFFVLRLDA